MARWNQLLILAEFRTGMTVPRGLALPKPFTATARHYQRRDDHQQNQYNPFPFHF